jgi:beta-N-acetylhexosaminidase
MRFQLKHYPEIRKQVEAMSVEDLLRSVLLPNVRAGHVMPRNTNAVFIHPVTAQEAKAASDEINRGRENKALIVSDIECCAASAIKGAVRFQPLRAARETGDPQIAYEMGVIAAKDALKAGYHWSFGPCVDILGNPTNPITSLRTAGGDPDDVITYCGNFMKGLQDTGLVATLKHFPGDGYSYDDQHVTVTDNPLSKEDWMNTFGKVYRTLIADGAMAVMPGHISLASYDEPDENGIYPPATVSRNLLTGLLREQLGFDGIVVSDATEMGGFCGYMNWYHGCAAFLEAGGDCLLFVHESEDFFDNMKKCIAEGRLSVKTLQERAYRMTCFTKQYFENMPDPEALDYPIEYAQQLAEKQARMAVKVVRDRTKILPMDFKGKRVAHIVIHNAWACNFSQVEGLSKELSKIAAKVEEIRDPGPQALLKLAKSGEWDYMIASVLEAPEWAVNTAKLCGPAARNMMCGWWKYDVPTAFVVWQSVCFAETYKAVTDTVINTYGATEYTPKAVIDKLMGKL